MTPAQEAALRDGLTNAFAIDADIATLPVFANIANSVKVSESGEVDAASVRNAVNEMRKARPALFQVVNYDDLSDSAFAAQEQRLRESMRKPRALPKNEFSGLDASGLSDEEDAALRRHLSGSRNSWDKAVLTRAMTRRRNENPPPSAA